MFKKYWYVLLITLVVGLIVGYIYAKSGVEIPVGSVTGGNEYYSTTTATNALNVTKVIKSGYGALGSVIITTAGNQSFDLIDATTTSITKRTGNLATSSLILASFPASAAAGTYTFDVTFSRGLLKVVNSGTLGTSTITYR